MGIMNYAINRLLERKDIFADFVNGVLFDGQEQIHPELLEVLSPNSGRLYKDEDNRLHVKEYNGDLRMKASEQYYSLIIVSEPQNKVHYAMPIRMMEYVAMEYRKQLQELESLNKKAGKLSSSAEYLSGIRKEDKITPVVALVLYCDSEHEWDGSYSLHEMIEWGAEPAFEDDMKSYVPDFKLNIIHVANLGKTEVFKTSLHYIFEMV